jgi:hypothetical protein
VWSHIDGKVERVVLQAIEQFLDDASCDPARSFDCRRAKERRKQAPLSSVLLAFNAAVLRAKKW